tara:strand:+ start:188 stop:565 length:378 start_codon:yes stop_codon:yes gene_type:complete
MEEKTRFLYRVQGKNFVCHSPHYILPYMEMINQGDNMSVTPENIKATTNVVLNELFDPEVNDVEDINITHTTMKVKSILGVPSYEGWLDNTIKNNINEWKDNYLEKNLKDWSSYRSAMWSLNHSV